MTSKTLKTKPNISLILDKEFIQYCELNKIKDIKKLAKETFKRGFDLLKYGSIPLGELTSQDKSIKDIGVHIQSSPPLKEIIKPSVQEKTEKPIIVEAVPMKSSDGKEVLTKMGVKTEKKDLYDE